MKTALRAAGLTAVLLLAACDKSDNEAPADANAPAGAASSVPVTAVAKEEWMTPRGDRLGDIEIGNPEAPVTIIEYASLTCPHCAKFGEETLEPFKKSHIATGKAKYVFRHFIMNQIDLHASMIARCGGVASYYGLMDMFFSRQSYWADQDYATKLAGLAARAGLSADKIDACVKDTALQKFLVDSTMTGQKEWGITGTPTIIVNGEKQAAGEITYAAFVKIVDAAARS